MNKEKNLVKNTMILAIGQLSSKVFTFLLLPVYTTLLAPDDYGTIDALQTIISLVLYFVTLQIESAIFRFIVENRTNKDNQISYVTSASVILFVMMILSTTILMIISSFGIISYVLLIILSLWSQSLYLFVSFLGRGLGKNKDYSISSFIVTLSSLLINIILIVGLKNGAKSILIASILSNFIGFVFLSFKLQLWKFLKLNTFDKEKVKEMLNYSLPLIPNEISWWIANNSNKLIIIYFLGSTYNGIYATASKIPTIYATIFTTFNIAWTESISLEINDNNRNEYINSVMNNYFKLFSFLNMGIIVCTSIFFKWFIGSQYVESYNHIFILLIAIFVNSMCSFLGGILGALKNTKTIARTTIVGAITNALLNLIFIRSVGLYAASISTLISYLVICLSLEEKVKVIIPIKISKEYLIRYLIVLLIVTEGYFYKNIIINVIILILLIVWGIYQNKKIIFSLLNSVKNKLLRE